MASMLILIVLLTVVVIPAIVLLAVGRTDDGRNAREHVDAPSAEGELPELLRRPLRGAR